MLPMSFSVLIEMSKCACYLYTARFVYDQDSVIDAQTTFAQFLEKITPEDKAVLEFYNWEEEIDYI